MSNKRTKNLIVTEEDTPKAKIILVGGVYKSGTSLLTASFEQGGAVNPAYRTSPIEFGHSAGGGLYQTRECGISRAINRKIVVSTKHERDKLRQSIKSYISEMVTECGNLIVIKDPYFKFTIGEWIFAANDIGVTVELNLTNRPLINTFNGWQRSRFLSWQLKKTPKLFNLMIQPLQKDAIKIVKMSNASVKINDYDLLVDMYGSEFEIIQDIDRGSCTQLRSIKSII